ncbi:uncharacterized protein N7498_007821 [Penicillium cinerascens]|uniref:Rhodopsin domain-containing protein n=1 Tax=Penicillium cinerascens TaxID=70096 RepID=A0A9W9JKQ1_9EURO|nr:uncharacterized protein N7498_007821 [Penicillium cinerascens]KAJ5198704.1 hypothetical protein N7498_007821 [Penicillium cinerascens]
MCMISGFENKAFGHGSTWSEKIDVYALSKSNSVLACGFPRSRYLKEMTLPGPHYWRNVLIIVPIIGTAIATIFFILRLCCRYVVAQKFRVEDLLMGMELLCTYRVAICQVYSAIQGIGIGQSIWALPREQRLRITLANWILLKFWPSAQVFVKVSVVLFLRRLFGLNKRFRHAATTVIIFVVAWGLTAIIGNTLQCWPVQYFWIKRIEGHCMSGQNTFFLVIGSLSVVEDVVILCLPLPIVWRLHNPTREKIEITLLFSMGCLVCIFSILGLVGLKYYQTDNLNVSSSLNLIWTILELDMAIICGCLLLIKPIFQPFMGIIRKGITRLSESCFDGSKGMIMAKSSFRESGTSEFGIQEVAAAHIRIRKRDNDGLPLRRVAEFRIPDFQDDKDRPP